MSDNRWTDSDWDAMLGDASEANDARQIHDRVHGPFLDWMMGTIMSSDLGDWVPRDVAIATSCMAVQAVADQFPEFEEMYKTWSEDMIGDEPHLVAKYSDIIASFRAIFMLGMCFMRDWQDGKVNLG